MTAVLRQETFNRRVNRAIVRAQARLEAGAGDRWIPIVLALFLGGSLALAGLERIDGFLTGEDLAGYSQAMWLITEGYQPRASMFGTGVHLLELRWSFIIYPLSLVGFLFEPAKVLVVAQGVAMGAAVLPLWGLARQVSKLRVGTASALSLAYCLHPATHRIGAIDFHPGALAVPALIGAAYFGATKKWIFYWTCVGLALACRADIGLAIGLWGLVLLGDGERRAGVWTLGVGILWSLALLLVGQPIIAEPGLAVSWSAYNGQTLGDTVLSSLRDPMMSLGDLLTQGNLTLVVSLLTPVIFLPVLSPRHLLPAAPLAGLLLVTSSDQTPFAEQAAVLLAFVMIACAHALNRLGTMGVDRVFLDVRILFALFAASGLSFVIASPMSPYEEPWNWGDRDQVDMAIQQAVDTLDPEAPVRASPSALVALSDRPWLYPLAPDAAPAAVNMGFPDFTRAVLTVDRDLPDRTKDERLDFDARMARDLEFELDFDDQDNGVALYVR